MSIRNSINTTAVTLLFAALFSGCGSSTKPVTSMRASAVPVVDGKLDDWDGRIRKVDKESFSMGVQNDGEFLYLSLVTIDNTVSSEVMRSGLEIWFDAAGAKEKTFGIRFPLGLAASGAQGARLPPGSRQGRGIDRREEAMEELFNASTDRLQLLAEGEDGLIVPSDGIPGIKIKSTMLLGTLTYELQIPLQQSDKHKYAVGSAPGSIVGISLETPKPDLDALRAAREERTDDMSGGDDIGSRAGSFGSPLGGGGMSRRGTPRLASNLQDQAVKYWAAVVLAN